MPDGVFNIVHGIGEEAGAALVRIPACRASRSPGRPATGQVIFGGGGPPQEAVDGTRRQVAVRRLRRRRPRRGDRLRFVRGVVAERRAVHRRLERILAERGIETPSSPGWPTRAARVKVGDPADPATEVGALVHPEHYDRVLSYVSIGTGEGARLVAGGSRPAWPGGTTWRRPCSRTWRRRCGSSGGDLRAGGVRDAVLVGVRGRRAGERHQVRARRVPVDVGPAPRAPGRRRRRVRDDLGKLAQRAGFAHPVRRGEGQSGSAGRAGSTRSTSTPSPGSCTSHSVTPTYRVSARKDRDHGHWRAAAAARHCSAASTPSSWLPTWPAPAGSGWTCSASWSPSPVPACCTCAATTSSPITT